MSELDFPVRPNLDQLRHQAKEQLLAIRSGDPAALSQLNEHYGKPIAPEAARLADAQMVLARRYGLRSWPRLVTSCRLIEAIWNDDAATVKSMILRHPRLLHENARGTEHSNWGPPMSYAANVGRTAIVEMLRTLGAADLQHAFGRACLQGKLDTARRLNALGAVPEAGSVMGPCETLSSTGLAFVLEMGTPFTDGEGDALAPLGLILETYSRNPDGKHGCLELVNGRVMALPDTPPLALHRGRIDLLEAHLRRNPELLTQTFTYREIFPLELGCHTDETLGLHGTPLAGGTLLHLAVDYDEMEIAAWLLDQGANVNAPAAVDRDGFGGHTALYGCVVSQPHRCGRQKDGAMARLLLDHGARTDARASLRKQLRFVADERLHEYRNVSPVEWGEQFHDQDWVSKIALQLIRERN